MQSVLFLACQGAKQDYTNFVHQTGKEKERKIQQSSWQPVRLALIINAAIEARL